jgi:fructose-1,6-bisphosphatase/inositol monophosphatase family enzyme
MVAAGDADLLATFRWGADWDIAAAVLIAREAGAKVTDALSWVKVSDWVRRIRWVATPSPRSSRRFILVPRMWTRA